MNKRTSDRRKSAHGASADGAATVAALQQRYQELERRRIEAGRDLKHAQDRLKTLESEAHEKYGTDDLDLLREKLEAMRHENAKRLEDYRSHLGALEKGLAEIETRYARQEAEESRSDLVSGARPEEDDA